MLTLVPTSTNGTSWQWCCTSGTHLVPAFVSDAGLSMAKTISTRSVSPYDSDRRRSKSSCPAVSTGSSSSGLSIAQHTEVGKHTPEAEVHRYAINRHVLVVVLEHRGDIGLHHTVRAKHGLHRGYDDPLLLTSGNRFSTYLTSIVVLPTAPSPTTTTLTCTESPSPDGAAEPFLSSGIIRTPLREAQGTEEAGASAAAAAAAGLRLRTCLKDVCGEEQRQRVRSWAQAAD